VDLEGFAADVGDNGPVTIAGLGSRGGAVAGARCVAAPSGIDWIEAEEMTVQCGAGTPVADLDAALAEVGQTVALPPGGTVGGALAVGRSGLRRLGHGHVRDCLLQARYVDGRGRIVKAGGPTVKNVSGFDLCRLLVGSWGTLGFLGEVILRTRPRPRYEQWYTSSADPFDLLARLYRPASVLWDGSRTWVLLEGHPDDVERQASTTGLVAGDPPSELPTGGRWSMPPRQLADALPGTGRFVAEVGVGVVHHEHPQPPRQVDPVVRRLHHRIKHEFDPHGRLNPGLDVLALD
jgi:FAD/FMN-containing dehydrogenase